MNREKVISDTTVIGAAGNTVLASLKLAAGLAGHSAAMTADAVHSFSDLVSDVIVLVMVRLSCMGKDKSHDYGHGKFETLASIIIAFILVLAGASLLKESIEKIILVLNGKTLEVPGPVALWAAVISIVVKEALYQWTSRVGHRVNSPAMITNAWHHRSDALSSVGSAAGIGGAMLLGGKWTVLDPAAGCIISLFIIVIAIRMSVPALHELTEGSLPEDMENDIIGLIESVPGVKDVHDLKTRKNGPAIILAAHVVVDPDMTVAEAHGITVLAENAVRGKYGRETQISIHVEPFEDSE